MATGQGFLGNNMFAYCGNNPVVNIDPTGTLYETSAGGESSVPTGQNTENILKFFGVTSVEDLPDIPDNAMLFMENITCITIAGVCFISGKAIVMDCDKYCLYTFSGISVGYSSIPYDHYVTKGYVYNVNDVSDYCGLFYSGSANYLVSVNGVALSTSDVYAEIIDGAGFLSISAGLSVANYSTPHSDWTYGQAKINWFERTYRRFDHRNLDLNV